MALTRSATVYGARSAKELAAYLPDNYRIARAETINGRFVAWIEGEDSHGWTLDGYVIPRLGSGLISAVETTHALED